MHSDETNLHSVSRRALSAARERFRALIQDRHTPESEWQALFADCPVILSRSLPVRIHEADVVPLARPGRPEPDFVFFPTTSSSPLSPYGVIELKRADTSLVRIPRKDVLTLSADASAAIAQARKYATELGTDLITRPEEIVIIGNSLHLFVIAGMSDELARKVTNEMLQQQYRDLLPGQCQIIPYDTLLRAFEAGIPPAIHILNTQLPYSVGTLRRFLMAIQTYYESYRGYWLDEYTANLWESLEKEFLFLLGPVAAYDRRIVRRRWEIIGSEPDDAGRRPLATEAPNPSLFALEVCGLVRRAIEEARKVGIQSSLSDDFETLWRRTSAYASD